MMKIYGQRLVPSQIQLNRQSIEDIFVSLVIVAVTDIIPSPIKFSNNGGTIFTVTPRDLIKMTQQPVLESGTGVDDLNTVFFG
jgi:hypothetical protein